MTITTQPVTVRIFDGQGQPCADGTIVTAKMDKLDVEAGTGLVVPSEVKGTTTAGIAVLTCFPNHPETGLGTTGSVWTFSASPAGMRSVKVQAQTPNSPTTLDAIGDFEQAEGLSEAAAALAGAQAAAGQAGASATAAGESADAAADSAEAAAVAKTAAETAQAAAEAARDAGEGHATDAANQVVAATQAKDAAVAAQAGAGQAAANADAARAAAETARDAAGGHAVTAADASAAAGAAKTAAEGFAQDAGTQAQAAADSANTAGMAAAAAADSEAGAETQRTAAEQARDLALEFQQVAQAAAALGAGYLNQLLVQFASATALSVALSTVQAQEQSAAAQAAKAARSAEAAAAIEQQDLSGVDAAALHRSPNAVTALFLYDTSKDSDGGAWIERVGTSKSWGQEALNGNWLRTPESSLGWQNELDARLYGATLGAEQVPYPNFEQGLTGYTTQGGPATLALSGSVAAVTITNGSNAGLRALAVPITAGKMYYLAVKVRGNVTGSALSGPRLYNGPTLLNVGGSTSTQQEGLQTLRGTFVAAATGTTNFDIIWSGTSLNGTMYVEQFSVKEVTAFTTASGDYYQLATDGKFYRLWKNLLSNSDMPFSDGRAVAAVRNGVNLYTATGSGSTIPYNSWSSAGGNSGLFPVTAGVQYTISFVAEQGTFAGTPSVQLLDSGGTTLSSPAALPIPAAGAGARVSVTVTATATSSNGQFRITGVTSGQTILMGAVQVAHALDAAAATYESKAASIGSVSEVFRGNKAKFPRLAAIVAEAANVTIYDLTEPGRPMWMRFTATAESPGPAIRSANAIGSLAALNGELVIGGAKSSGDIHRMNFIKDGAQSHGTANNVFLGNIAQRNSPLGHVAGTGSVLAGRYVNAVAMMVRPTAPTDPVTLLPVPTIGVAVGTGAAGQLGTVLMDDGTAVNYSATGNDGASVAFTKRGEVVWAGSASTSMAVMPLAATNQSNIFGGGGASARLYNSVGTVGLPALGTISASNKRISPAGSVLATAATPGVVLQRENPSTQAAGLVANITGTYNTGWMTGDIRRALLADVLAGTASGAELSTGAWYTPTGGYDNVVSGASVSGFTTTAGTGLGQTRVAMGLTTIAGREYTIVATPSVSFPGAMYARDVADTGPVITATTSNFVAGTPQVLTFRAVSAVTYVLFLANPNAAFTISAFSVKEIAADRSVKAKNASINGTLAKTAVASAAQLVAYSGFSNDPAQTTELVSNGTFTTDLSGWTVTTAGTSTVTWSAGSASFSPDGTNPVTLAQSIATVVGRRYTAFFDIATNSLNVSVGTTNTGQQVLAPATLTVGTGRSVTFVAQTTTTWINFYKVGASVALLDNVSCKPADAIGSAANVLQEAYSADLDYGTGSWSTSAWFTAPTDLTPYLPELTSNLAVNGDFSGGTASWTPNGAATFTVNGSNQGVLTNSGASEAQLTQAVLTSGKFYKATMNRVAATTATGSWLVGGVRAALSAGTPNTIVAQAGSTGFGVATNSASAGHSVTVDDISVKEVGPMVLIDRSGPSGAYWRLQMLPDGRLQGIAYDGTTTRTVTSTAAYNDGTAHKARLDYTTTSLTLKVDGEQVAQTTGSAMLTLNNSLALCTVGNSFALNAAFPGSLALVKTSATVPTTEQARWMYAQERAMFQPSAQVTLPDTGNVVAMDYDAQTDALVVATAANEATFNGLVRTSYAASAAGSISKVFATAGAKLVARTTTNPGVDVTLPSQNLRAELVNRAEAAAQLARLTRRLDFDAITGQMDFTLPIGWEIQGLTSAGVEKREGATKDWTRLFDGFKETARFGVAPGNGVWVQAEIRRAA
jgi:hypothetical protein